ncbi:SGNH/GDSL hydrolase family protein [Exilibacterium tricleocarpae]|uniref:SGNH/GDSL hydrolase family protein n=1 Tax=Exilibacterium tricleocarpae TaxID=2591008 RepID=A0A545SZ28_9GAMM|nr:SGNH/GDSL hydrolase family protein [Exilibacterium tricleocarpae]
MLFSILTAAALTTASASWADTPARTTAAGDSITMAFAANCKGNVFFWELFCLLGGDQPRRSWFDGNRSEVDSVHDKYKRLDPGITANKNAAASGSELRGGGNNFSVQANNIVAQTNTPDHVEVLLGGNDICNRDCTDPANCGDPLYTEGQWRSSVQAGLDILVAGLPTGSTVYFGSVPRVQDLRAAGLAKQASTIRVNCESIWNTFNICGIATSGGTVNGEGVAQRLASIAATQRRYNEILLEESNAYNSNSNGRNPRGIEVVADYVDETTPSTGTFQFNKDDIDGGDCFHPSVQGQNTIADLMWNANPDK